MNRNYQNVRSGALGKYRVAAKRPALGFLLAAIAMMLLPTPARTQESGMTNTLVYRQLVNGDFVTAGAYTRQFGLATPQNNVFGLNLSGLAGTTIVKAYANWSFLTDNPNDASLRNITIDGHPVTGALSGTGSPDLGWGFNYGASFLADVTSLITGNGTYQIGGATDHAGSVGEGISLLVVYQKTGMPAREVDVYSGYTSTASGEGRATFGFLDPYAGDTVHFYLNALDGQRGYSDQFFIGTNDVSGKLGGGSAGDAWQGRLGNNADSNLYDRGETNDISAFMRLGDTDLIAQTLGAQNSGSVDFIAHTFGGISIVPEPAACGMLGLGLLGLVWRRWHRLPRRTFIRSATATPADRRSKPLLCLLFGAAPLFCIMHSASAQIWRSVGPTNLDVPYEQWYGQRATSGRVSALAWSRSNTNVVYLGSAGGGVWKSTDRGATWNVTGSDTSPAWSNLQATAVAVDPGNENIVYAGTGDYRAGLRAYGFGLLRSLDGGGSWTVLTNFANQTITKVLVDPDNTQILTVVTGGSGISRPFGFDGSVYRSVDGGATWTVAFPTTASWSDGTISGKDKTGKRYYYVAGWDGAQTHLWLSSNRGTNWNDITPRVRATTRSLSVSASQVNPQTVYLLATGNKNIFKSPDAGGSWSSIKNNFPNDSSDGDPSDTDYNWSQGNYDYHIEAAWIPGTSVDVVYVGLITLAGSPDAGAKWTNISLSYEPAGLGRPRAHNDQQSLAFNPRNPNEVIFGNDGGVYKVSFDPKTGVWGPLSTTNSRTLGITQFYGAAYSSTEPDHIIGGTQDNASPRSYGANSFDGQAASVNLWANTVTGGDGGNAAIHPMNDSIAFASEIGSGTLSATVDAWANRTRIARIPTFSPVTPVTLDGTTTNPITVYSLDTSGNVLVRYTWDGAANITTNILGNGAALTGGRISAIAIAPGDNTRIYVGGSDGQVWMTRNALEPTPANVVWERIDPGTNAATSLPTRNVTSISVNPFNQSGMLVGFGGTGANHLWGCGDVTAGAAARVWEPLAAPPVPDVSLNAITRSPADPNNIWYVGTDSGVFCTTNTGANWRDITQPNGLPNVLVTDLKAMGGTGFLYAGTFGRGIWRAPIATGQIAGFGITPNPTLPLFFTTTLGRVTLSQPAPPGGVTVSLSCDHPLVFPFGFRTIPAGEISITFNALAILVTAPQTIKYTVTLGAESRDTYLKVVSAIPVALRPLLPSPVIQSIVRAETGGVTINWSGMAGSTYRVQYTDSLDAPTWIDMTPDIVADQESLSFTDNPGGAPQRFYRIVLLH